MKGIKNELKLFIIVFIIGLVFLILGAIDINFIVIGFGISTLLCSLIKIIQLYKLTKNKEKAKEYINMINDERYKYINMRAYSAAFWCALYLEFIVLSILSLIGFQLIAAILGCIVSFKLIIYLLFNIYFSKKY